MKKRQSPPKLRIRRETLLPLAPAAAMERIAGGVIYSFDVCGITELCTLQAACQSRGSCPSIDDECHPSLAEATCFC